MSLGKFFKTKKGKQIQNTVYCWGACFVIAGAIFKIMGVEYADLILYIGLIVEVGIFFLAGFEEQDEDYEWDRVYPQLRGKRDSRCDDPLTNSINTKLEGINDAYETQITDMLKQMETMSQQLNTLNQHYGRIIDVMENKNKKTE